MKKLVVVLAVAFSGVLNAQTNISQDLNINDTIKDLVLARHATIESEFITLVKLSAEKDIDSLLDVHYKSIIGPNFDIDFRGFDYNDQLIVAVFDLNAFKPENFDQTARNISFVTTLNNVESAFLRGILLKEIEIVFANLEK